MPESVEHSAKTVDEIDLIDEVDEVDASGAPRMYTQPGRYLLPGRYLSPGITIEVKTKCAIGNNIRPCGLTVKLANEL